MTESSPIVLFSFDVEEFDIPLEFGTPIGPREQMRIGIQGFARALHLLDEVGVRATLYMTGAIALAAPELVRWAVRSGHEIASHSLEHSRFETSHLLESRTVLERVSGTRVVGFRMPRLAPVGDDDLVKAGYLYNSSLNPIWLPGRYNHLRSPRLPHRRGGLVQVPLSATPVLRWPLFWLAFKNQPAWLTRRTTARCLEHDRLASLYFHPWELCECTGFGLPASVARCSGERLYHPLRDYLLWLKSRARFETTARYVQEHIGGRDGA